MSALLGQMLPLLQLLSSQVAGNQGVAVDADAIGEVLAGHTDPAAFPVRKLTVVNKGPLIHSLVLR